MKIRIFALGIMVLLTLGCQETVKSRQTTVAIEVQGHRGDRGNFPENTIPAFISAVKKGADVIELDVVVSKDHQIVVSHEPYMSGTYMLAPNGMPIAAADEKSYNLYVMMYDSIKRFDAGSKGNASFPQQQKLKAYKPLLSEVIDSVEQYVAKHNTKPVRYNIEIKSAKEEYGLSQPQPEVFTALVMEIIESKGIKGRSNIQSFDPLILNIVHKKHPEVKTAFLTDKPGIDKNLALLTFTPDIYSPHYKLVNPKFLDSAAERKMRVIPWTVNDPKDIDRMIKLRVAGIITDYPERVIHKIH